MDSNDQHRQKKRRSFFFFSFSLFLSLSFLLILFFLLSRESIPIFSIFLTRETSRPVLSLSLFRHSSTIFLKEPCGSFRHPLLPLFLSRLITYLHWLLRTPVAFDQPSSILPTWNTPLLRNWNENGVEKGIWDREESKSRICFFPFSCGKPNVLCFTKKRKKKKEGDGLRGSRNKSVDTVEGKTIENLSGYFSRMDAVSREN